MPRLADDRANAVTRYLHDWLVDTSLPGASVAIVHGDDLAYSTGAGARDLEADDPATPETLFGVGSVTKSFTALAIARLHDEGELAFDDQVTEYVDAVDEDFDAKLHELLSHASGMPSLGVSEALIARRAGVGEYGVPLSDAEDFYQHFNEGLGERMGDDSFRYSNSGYTLLGETIEAVDGRPFDRYVDEEILDPLGMARSTFDSEMYAEDSDSATPYFFKDGDAEAVPLPVRERSYAAGGLLTPVTELARYLRYNVAGELDGTELVDGDTLERLHAGHTETPQGPYGYGWRRREFLDRTLVGHGGSIAVSTAYVGFTTGGDGEEWGVALAANAAPDHSLSGPAQAMLAAAMGHDPGDVAFVARRRALEEFTGRYESFRGIKEANVTKDGATLRFEFTDELEGGETPLVPVDPTAGEFAQPLSNGDRRPVTFERTDDGIEFHIDRWRLHRVGTVDDN